MRGTKVVSLLLALLLALALLPMAALAEGEGEDTRPPVVINLDGDSANTEESWTVGNMDITDSEAIIMAPRAP